MIMYMEDKMKLSEKYVNATNIHALEKKSITDNLLYVLPLMLLCIPAGYLMYIHGLHHIISVAISLLCAIVIYGIRSNVVGNRHFFGTKILEALGEVMKQSHVLELDDNTGKAVRDLVTVSHGFEYLSKPLSIAIGETLDALIDILREEESKYPHALRLLRLREKLPY